MPDEASRVLGLAGLRVTCVVDGEGDALDLESVGAAGACPHCGGEDLVIKERPVVGCATWRWSAGSPASSGESDAGDVGAAGAPTPSSTRAFRPASG